MVIFIVSIVFILLEQKINLNLMKKYVKIKIFVELHCHQKRKFNQCVKSDKMSYVMLRKRLY